MLFIQTQPLIENQFILNHSVSITKLFLHVECVVVEGIYKQWIANY